MSSQIDISKSEKCENAQGIIYNIEYFLIFNNLTIQSENEWNRIPLTIQVS